MNAKGQITVPKSIRDALGLRGSGTLVFRVEDDHAVLTVVPDLLDLAGAVEVPGESRGMPWAEARRRAWAARGEEVVRDRLRSTNKDGLVMSSAQVGTIERVEP